MLIYVIMGCPGSGKGSISSLLVDHNDFIHISTGKLFRELKKEEILKIAEHADNFEEEKKNIEKGLFVSDQITNLILKNKLEEAMLENKNIVLDGFPRTIKQAEFLSHHFSIHKVIYLNEVTDELIMNRLCNRYICKKSEHIFNISNFNKEKDGFCVHDGSELFQRQDDKFDVIKKRISIYNESTMPVIEYYKKNNLIVNVSSNTSVTVLYKKILEIINI